MIDLSGYGRVALITGCSGGIGLATTLLFLKQQYQVFGVDITPFDYSLLDQHLPPGSGNYQERFHFHQGDLTAPDECDNVVRICVGVFGLRIDVLANVAGMMDHFASADSFGDEEWERVLGINLSVPAKMMRAVLPFMKSRGQGTIVNVCSKAGVSGAAAGLAYTASKHGLIGVTKQTAWRFHNEGIRCNAVLPGGINPSTSSISSASTDSDLFDKATYETVMAVHALHGPIGALPDVQAGDVANAVLFLASDQARMINGVCLPVDKAWSVI